MSPKSPLILTAIASAALIAALAHTQPVHATNACPTDVDACVVVNSNLDNNLRDDVVTLREALLIANGSLTLANLTIPELGQVVITMPPGWGPEDSESLRPFTPPGFGGPGGIGKTAVNFDRNVFCAGCASNTIYLDPTVDSGLTVTAGETAAAALPVLAPATDSKQAADWQVRLGDGSETIAGLAVKIDGSRLSSGATGLAVAAPGVTLKGVTLQRFPGTAVSLTCEAATAAQVDAKFANNGTDIATDSCWSQEP